MDASLGAGTTYAIGEVAIAAQVPLQTQLLQQCRIGSGQQLVEDVEVTLARSLGNHTRLLQQIVKDVAANGCSLKIELDVHVLAEA